MNIPIVSQQNSISHSYALSKKLRLKEVFQRVDLYLDGVQDSFSPLVHDHIIRERYRKRGTLHLSREQFHLTFFLTPLKLFIGREH